MLTVRAWRDKAYDTGGRVYAGQIRRLPEMTSHVNGAILPEVMGKFMKAREWRECEDALRRVADAQAAESEGKPSEADTKFEGDPSEKVGAKDERPARRHGFEPDMDRHQKIAAVVERHAPGWRMDSGVYRKQAALEKICLDLDAAEVDIPKSWKSGGTPALNGLKVRNWEEALELGTRKLVADQLRTSLNKIQITVNKPKAT
jgi:hypothetical protein